MDFSQFILSHDASDPAALALQRSRLSTLVEDWDLAISTLEVRRKIRTKVPEWYAVPSLRYPLRLSGEQCSSSETASYKAALALRSASSVSSTKKRGACFSIADLTGGLGVDSWAFSKVAGKVLYNEMNPALSAAARLNFKELGAHNIIVTSHEIGSVSIREALGSFVPDVIYLDPARRGEGGRKVFRLEDCSPDVTTLLPDLYEACPRIMLKLSPMADITLVCNQLPGVKEVHVVEAEGECKELLLILEKGWSDGYTITVYAAGKTLSFNPLEEASSVSAIVDGEPRGYLFEPGKGLLKSGAFKLLCARFGLWKLGVNTHLYSAAAPVEELEPFGKWFTIERVLPFGGKSMKQLKGIKADVTSRGLPLTSDELRRRCGILPGDGSVHIFAASTAIGNLLLLCRR
ncbi:MAG: hypothetical protein J5835_08445 [Bacteroidales bacterium]|nr:hypothetical protein [Bacteroidales bacterium]